jgi:hypothetical protein
MIYLSQNISIHKSSVLASMLEMLKNGIGRIGEGKAHGPEREISRERGVSLLCFKTSTKDLKGQSEGLNLANDEIPDYLLCFSTSAMPTGLLGFATNTLKT